MADEECKEESKSQPVANNIANKPTTGISSAVSKALYYPMRYNSSDRALLLNYQLIESYTFNLYTPKS